MLIESLTHKSANKNFIILKDLKSENIEGRIISERKKALGISLGVFPTLEAAEEFRSTHEKEGAMIAETPLVERAFVILTEGAEAADISSILDSSSVSSISDGISFSNSSMFITILINTEVLKLEKIVNK